MVQKQVSQLSPTRASVPALYDLPLLKHDVLRDVYELDNGLALVVTHDVPSVFGFSLDAAFPLTGEVVTVIAVKSHERIEHDLGIPTPLVASGADVNDFLPYGDRDNPYWQLRGMVVRRLNPVPATFTASAYLNGNVLRSCEEDREVEVCIAVDDEERAGHANEATMRDAYAKEIEYAERIYRHAHAVAKPRGGILAQATFEFGRGVRSGKLYLSGQPLTLGVSALFWCVEAWNACRHAPTAKALPAQGTQPLLDWAAGVGIDKLDPYNPDDVALVHGLRIPDELIAGTSKAFVTALKVQWGMSPATSQDAEPVFA